MTDDANTELPSSDRESLALLLVCGGPAQYSVLADSMAQKLSWSAARRYISAVYICSRHDSQGIARLILWYNLSQTEFMKRKVEGEGWDTQLGVWGRGVDPDLFSPARRCQDLRRQLGLGPNDIAALWLGRVVKEKQPGVWLRVRGDDNTSCFCVWGVICWLDRPPLVSPL